MGATSPADAQSAGFLIARGATGPRGPQPSDGEPPRRLASSVLTASPVLTAAVRAVDAVREAVGPRAWDGLVHRGCSVGARGASPAAAPLLLRAERGGWELLRAQVVVHGRLVTHELARLVGEAPVPAVPVPAAPAPSGQEVPEGARTWFLGAQDVADWAALSGDRNVVHRVPGAARAAGLAVGEGAVVAHGMCLAAVALGLRGAEPRGVRLRFLAPCAVTGDAVVPLWWEETTGLLRSPQGPHLRLLARGA